MRKPIYDLIYDETIRPQFIAQYPTAKIEDASDMVHEERFSILLPPEVTTIEYYKFLFKHHLGGASFYMGRALAQRHPEVLEAWKQVKAERTP